LVLLLALGCSLGLDERRETPSFFSLAFPFVQMEASVLLLSFRVDNSLGERFSDRAELWRCHRNFPGLQRPFRCALRFMSTGHLNGREDTLIRDSRSLEAIHYTWESENFNVERTVYTLLVAVIAFLAKVV
jgi:hypothetical protein